MCDFSARMGIHEETLRRWETDGVQIDRAQVLVELLKGAA